MDESQMTSSPIQGPLLDMLKLMVEKNGSDLYLTVGSRPGMKIDGKLVYLGEDNLKSGHLLHMGKMILGHEDLMNFQSSHEVNLAISIAGIGRFRVNGYYQRSELAFVIRRIMTTIPSMESLNLPPVLKEIAMSKRGLVLFVGATGSGKSTSLASMVGYRNEHDAGHILTIEDPVEFMHKNAMSIVSQREVGIDTDSYDEALKNALREAPDVILIGEIRTKENMDHAIAFAETGHLCLSTLHANNANQAIDRIINFFPEERHRQVLMDLSLNLRAIISQRLIPTLTGGRTAAMEILIGSPRVQDLIKNGKIDEIKATMAQSRAQNMQTFDQSITDLVMNGVIGLQDAMLNADSQNDTRLAIQQACLKAGVPDVTKDAKPNSDDCSTQWQVKPAH